MKNILYLLTVFLLVNNAILAVSKQTKKSKQEITHNDILAYTKEMKSYLQKANDPAESYANVQGYALLAEEIQEKVKNLQISNTAKGRDKKIIALKETKENFRQIATTIRAIADKKTPPTPTVTFNNEKIKASLLNIAETTKLLHGTQLKHAK